MATKPSDRAQCRYCQRTFAKESTLAAHVCEQKRRHQERGEPGVHLGFQAYLKFYEYTQGTAKPKTWDDFVSSPYYRAFVKWGRYCVGLKAVNPQRFLEWLLKNNKKIDQWCKDTFYTEYLIVQLKTEAIADALDRAINYSQSWAEQTHSPAQDFLRYGNRNALCHAVTTGRISPWVIYNSDSGQQFLSDITSEQVNMIWPYIDTDSWQKKFQQYQDEQEQVREFCKYQGW
jgi:hypothetical protein